CWQSVYPEIRLRRDWWTLQAYPPNHWHWRAGHVARRQRHHLQWPHHRGRRSIRAASDQPPVEAGGGGAGSKRRPAFGDRH
ncbi:hypothetical protein ABTN38_20565, partial [Acinetobacter baumannii]